MVPILLQYQVPEELHELRLDKVLAQLCPDYSRETLKSWICEGLVQVDGLVINLPKHKVLMHQLLSVEPVLQTKLTSVPEKIPLNVLFEDDTVLVINKPVGLVVHPGAGNPQGTLMNALLAHHPDSQYLPRAGIIHRLDKDTSGILIIAKTLSAHHYFVDQLQQRLIKREYEAFVYGHMIAGATINQPIDRHPRVRTKMAIVASGKPAVSHVRVHKRYKHHTWVRVQLETGRTHQIRVHLQHHGYPLIGDPTYGGRLRFPKKASESLRECLQGFQRQALHARQITFVHPVTKETLTFEAPLPDDLQQLQLCLVANDACT